MRKTSAIVLTTWLVTLASQAQVQIINYAGNGTVTWNSPSGSVSTIEWASTLTPSADWQRNWIRNSDVRSTNTQSTVGIPMFYRVSCWTNGLFLSMPIGRTYVYRVTETNGFVYTIEMSCFGQVHGPLMTNGSHYVLLAWKQIGYPDADAAIGFETISASDNAAYALSSDGQLETRWQRGPVGMTWTNQLGNDVVASTLMTNETVTVPAGTFSNVVWYRETFIDLPPPDNTRDSWVQPGFFLVKYVNDEGDGEVLELESWRDE